MKRIVSASGQDIRSQRNLANKFFKKLHAVLDFMDEYDDYMFDLLDDSNFYDQVVDQLKYLDSLIR